MVAGATLRPDGVRLCAPWDEAKALQRPALKIVMRGADTEDRATRSGSTLSAQPI